ncbi:MAG: peptidoglycan editing factor PgeF [Pseudomonadota bacterium]
MTIDVMSGFIQPQWPAPASVKAFSSLRQSGVGEDPAVPLDDRDVMLLQQALQIPATPIWLKQIHGNIAIQASPENSQQEGDALFTDKPNTVCVIRTADCIPIFFTTKTGSHIAAIHAGWRGLASGIIDATLQKLPVAPAEILAWLGPGIGPERFEVRKDVYDIFTLNDPGAEPAFNKISDEQWLADLFMLARQRLQKLGITQIFGGDYCTYSDPEHFFSYRRDGKLTGRILSLIWIEDLKNTKVV